MFCIKMKTNGPSLSCTDEGERSLHLCLKWILFSLQVMGHVIKNGLECLGTGRNIRLDAELRKDVDVMVSLANKNNATARERKHAGAVKLWADGYVFNRLQDFTCRSNDPSPCIF